MNMIYTLITFPIQRTLPPFRRAAQKPKAHSAKTSCREATVLMEVDASSPTARRSLKLTWIITDPTRQRDAMLFQKRGTVVSASDVTSSTSTVARLTSWSRK